jgi:glycosyltransferase involved in cell wall biosynthesis
MPDLRTSWLAWRELGAVPTTNAAVGGCPRESIDHRFAIDGDDVRLSVVIPAHNEAVVIGACLRSLAAQDFASAFEVIVVDNGSTDETPVIAASLGARVIREQRLGVCWARQSGTLAARGQIVVSTDADTTFDAGWLSNINAKFGADPALVAVAGRCRFVEAPWWGTAYTWLLFSAVAVVSRVTGRVWYVTATNVAFRRSAWTGYNTHLTQGGDELDLLRRLRACGKVGFDRGNVTFTSSRRLRQGLLYNIVVTCLYYYLVGYVLNRVFGRTVLGTAPHFRGDANARTRTQCIARLARTAVWIILLAVGGLTTYLVAP